MPRFSSLKHSGRTSTGRGCSRRCSNFRNASAATAAFAKASLPMRSRRALPATKVGVVAILGPGDFFGEGCLAGQSVRMGMATAITLSTVLVIEKNEMFKVLHEEHGLSGGFRRFMLARNIRIEEDLIDQLFNSSEKRLARPLLLLAS